MPPTHTYGNRIGGLTYTDLLHIYGMSRAGYVPQLFSLRLPNPEVIFELLHKANAKALVYDSSFANVVKDSPVPSHLAVGAAGVAPMDEPLPAMPHTSIDDTAFFFHTSGSTSGSPKLVAYSYRWFDSAIRKSYQIMKPRNPDRQDVTTWM